MNRPENDVAVSRLPGEPTRLDSTAERIQAALRGLRFGTVTLVVQDGVVVQVERTEKFRFERREARGPS